MRRVNRIIPRVQPQFYKTYQISAPQSTHWHKVTCERVSCPNQQFGWTTRVDEMTALGQEQAYYIRNLCGRKFSEHREIGLTVFVFAPDQQCFREHELRGTAPELYLVRGGDWRGNPTGTETRQHTRSEDWVDDFANHQLRLAELIEKG